MNKKLEKEIKEICTYYSEFNEGTAGYSLSEEQFSKLFALFRSQQLELLEGVINLVKEELDVVIPSDDPPFREDYVNKYKLITKIEELKKQF